MHEPEKEARDRLIDAARTDVVFLAERQTGLAEALDRLDRQAYGDAGRLQAAAEQLRARFSAAEAIPLLEAAARQVEHPTDPEPPVRIERSDRADTDQPEPS